MTTCSRRQIYLIGANSLLNELLATFIAEKSGAAFTAGADLSCIPVASACGGVKRLILYDYSDPQESLEDLIASDKANLMQTDCVVLTNISDDLEIECEAMQCGVRGFLYYQGGVAPLLKMISSVLNSEHWISRELTTKLLLDGGLKKAIKTQVKPASPTAQELNSLGLNASSP